MLDDHIDVINSKPCMNGKPAFSTAFWNLIRAYFLPHPGHTESLISSTSRSLFLQPFAERTLLVAVTVTLCSAVGVLLQTVFLLCFRSSV